MTILILYSVITSLFFICFEAPDSDSPMQIVDLIVQFMFMLELFICFFNEYRDGDLIVRDLPSIF